MLLHTKYVIIIKKIHRYDLLHMGIDNKFENINIVF